MRELKFLDQACAPSLDKLLIAQHTAHADHLRRNLPFFMANNGEAQSIGITLNRMEVEQALLVFFQRPNAQHDYLAISTAVTCESTFHAELFDSLCASCSSATPTIVFHLVVTPRHLTQAVSTAWQKSRLGKYTIGSRLLTNAEGEELLGQGTVIFDSKVQVSFYKIQYPSESSLHVADKGNTIRRCKYC